MRIGYDVVGNVRNWLPRASLFCRFSRMVSIEHTHTQKKRRHTAERQAARGELRHIFHSQPSSIHLLADLWPFILRRSYTSVIIRSRPITSYTLMYVLYIQRKKNILFEKEWKSYDWCDELHDGDGSAPLPLHRNHHGGIIKWCARIFFGGCDDGGSALWFVVSMHFFFVCAAHVIHVKELFIVSTWSLFR